MDNGDVRRDSTGLSWIGSEGTGLVLGQIRPSTGNDPRQHFCSIEYIDEEGDKVIKHAFLTVEEQKTVVEQCIQRGIKAKVYDLNPPAVSSEE